ncbi:Fic family protein [Granulicella tundricola]|uniref:Filamentation induced by cAMP protein Fic n=1 Tax=Granulicella tundricola (strain ATCC BAA-1859 / DSM 23138 / MP5ACTX9) TaxID=1198114 RepID=E8WZX1_GRATM|nr:Fic family protein [Granulicella tundricola]ADW67782.1 filamentation induced by cAMP protein Fic [Granulicella tundricola MP5ACTX9]
MAEEIRHSKADEAVVVTDPKLAAELEAANGLKQYNLVTDMVQAFLDPERPFRLRPSHIQGLHRAALQGLTGYAGNWRPSKVGIQGSKHAPPEAFEVPERIEELCDYVNDRWKDKSPIHLAAYVMWRLNWIHPFTDGNGRTSRAVSYLVLCVRLGYLLPGHLTIPDQIEAEKTPYYKALEAADVAWAENRVDLTAMKGLLSTMLAKQLLAVHQESGSGGE